MRNETKQKIIEMLEEGIECIRNGNTPKAEDKIYSVYVYIKNINNEGEDYYGHQWNIQ